MWFIGFRASGLGFRAEGGVVRALLRSLKGGLGFHALAVGTTVVDQSFLGIRALNLKP